jgi:hypothetical protein
MHYDRVLDQVEEMILRAQALQRRRLRNWLEPIP